MRDELVRSARERLAEDRAAEDYARAAEERLRAGSGRADPRWFGRAAVGVFVTGVAVAVAGPAGWDPLVVLVAAAYAAMVAAIPQVLTRDRVRLAIAGAYERGVPLESIRAAVEEAGGYDDAVEVVARLQPPQHASA